MKRAYKLRAYPTRPQEGRAVRLLADHCDLYNAALQERREAWRRGNLSISHGDQSAQLKEIRAADPDRQGRHSFAQQQSLRRLNTAFAAHVKRVRDAERAGQRAERNGRQPRVRRVGHPRFKPYQRFDQVLFVAGDGARWEPAHGSRWAYAIFKAVGRIKVGQHRPMVGRVRTLQLKRESRRWYVVVVTETEAVPLPATGRSVGVDVGVVRFLTTSDGEVVPNPRLSTPPNGQSLTCNAAPDAPDLVPATADGSCGPSPKRGARSATGGGTFTTRPPARWSPPATRLPSNSSAWPP